MRRVATALCILAGLAFGCGKGGSAAPGAAPPPGQTGPGATGGAPPAAASAGPAPLAAPLPTAAVDEALFPRNLPSRYIARGQTFFVAPNGNDGAAGTASAPFRTIGRGIQAASASAGNKVVVRGGVYAEGASGGPVALRVARDGLVVAAAPGEQAVVRPLGPGVVDGLEIAASHVTWSGVSFKGFQDFAVSIGEHGRTVSDIVLADCRIVMARGADGVAIYPDHTATGQLVVDGLLLERVAIEGADHGFTVSAGPVRSISLSGITVKNRAAGTGGSGEDGIGVEGGDNVLVNGAEVTGADGDGIDLMATRAAILDAPVHGVGHNGIQLWQGGDVVNCLVHDCAADTSISLVHGGAPGRAPARYRVVNSLVAFHNRRAGAAPAYVMTVGYDYPSEPIELDLMNSVFYRNTGGLALSRGTRATVRGCLFFGAANHQVADYDWDGNNALSIDEAAGVASLARLGSASQNLPFAADPLLLSRDASSLDGFRPASASPLVDAGVVAQPFPASDLVGGARQKGPRPDLGPLEAR